MKSLKTLFYKPLSTQLTITSTNGFHLRPAAKFASEAKQFTCDIHIEFSDKKISAKAVNAILSLNLDTGDTFTLIANGKDAKRALDILDQTFQLLMSKETTVVEVEKEAFTYEGVSYPGEIISEGIAVGKVHHFSTSEVKTDALGSFGDAVKKSVNELERLYENSQKDSNAHIYIAQKELLLSLTEKVDSLEAFETVIKEEQEKLQGGKNASKAADLGDLLHRVKTHMGYQYKVTLPNTPFILTADDLLPSQIKTLERSAVLGVALANSTLTSHTAILLRASGIPSILLEKPLSIQSDKVILDAYSGCIVGEPSADDLKQAFRRQTRDEKAHMETHTKRFEPAIDTNGKRVKVLANVSDLDSAKTAKEEGAEGIGLLRSEFLFKEHKPLVRDQLSAYQSIFELFEEVTVRTLDVGGDKSLPYIDLPKEQNPFLGIRGIRLLKTDPELLSEQLEAIFLAAQNRPVKIMFPMIATPDEFIEAKNFALDVARKKDILIDHIKFGMMIEVPSVLFMIPQFNELVDFYSIGTNDLAQYLFAIERTHPTLKIDPLSPVLFDAIKKVKQESTKPVSICGELGGDKRAIPTLIELGIETLSVSGKNVPQTKEVIRNV